MDSPTPSGIEKVAHGVAVASGKGGVGKTTVAVNLALALANQGYRVGLLDADVYGPSIPTMLALHEQPEMEEGGIIPLQKYGIKIISMAASVRLSDIARVNLPGLSTAHCGRLYTPVNCSNTGLANRFP